MFDQMWKFDSGEHYDVHRRVLHGRSGDFNDVR